MNFFTKIWDGVKFVALHIAAGFKVLFGDKAAQDFATATLAFMKTELGKMVVGVIIGLDAIHDMPNDAKRLDAFAQIVKALEAEGKQSGKDFFAHEVNLMIEAVINALRGRFAVTEEPIS